MYNIEPLMVLLRHLTVPTTIKIRISHPKIGNYGKYDKAVNFKVEEKYPFKK